MFTRSQYAALLLAAIFAATGVVSDSTILLNSGGVSISKPKVNHGPLTTIPTAAPVTTTTTTTHDTAPAPNVVLSAASTASTLPAAIPQGPLGNVTHNGFSAPLKKKRTSKADSSTPKRSDNFNSSIVDQWHVVLQVGTPGQEVVLGLDLGSDGFVVDSTLEPADMQTTDYPIYNPNISTTAHQMDGYTWYIEYQGFASGGVIFTDVVTWGENSWSNMNIDVVTAEPEGTPITDASGILGLSAHLLTDGSPAQVPSFLGFIKDQLEHVLFTLWFNSTVPSGPDGSIDFGFIDETKYTGDIAYTPLYNIEGNTFWSVNISGIGAADPYTGALLSSNMTQFTAILDTGSAQSQLPSAVQWGYYGGIPGSTADAPPGSSWDTPQGYPCSVNTSLPDLVLFIEDKTVVIPRSTYGWTGEYWYFDYGVPGVIYCKTELGTDEYVNQDFSIIGADLIEGLFLVLDWDNQQVGFANSTVMNTDSSFYIPGLE